MVVKFDFNQMIVNTTLFLVRRLSTESYMEVPERHEYHTTWIWYWCNDIGQWTPYAVRDHCIVMNMHLSLESVILKY